MPVSSRSRRFVSGLAPLAWVLVGVSLLAQGRAAEEARREQWQKVDEIFAAMGIRPGATVADVGAGDGFFTSRLAKAVGPDGRVYAVDIDDSALGRLRRRMEQDDIRNVVVVKGAAADPKLPEGALDAALIVNAYHEMTQHQAVLSNVRRALKPEGRLVIVEPIADARRDRSRGDQVRAHEIAPEFVLADARAAGFRIVALQDPFTKRERDIEFLVALQPADIAGTASPPVSPAGSTDTAVEAINDPSLRISQKEFRKLVSSGAVTIVDVRDAESFDRAHIPDALLAPLSEVGNAVEQLRRLGKPVVTYCS